MTSVRQPPEPLTRRVSELVASISSDPYGIDPTTGKTALDLLRDLYESMEATGTPDPFLTEMMADETPDDREAIGLYARAIEQCASFPGEPVHTKRCAMATRLLQLGDIEAARHQLKLAIEDAKRAGEPEEARYAEEALETLPGAGSAAR